MSASRLYSYEHPTRHKSVENIFDDGSFAVGVMQSIIYHGCVELSGDSPDFKVRNQKLRAAIS